MTHDPEHLKNFFGRQSQVQITEKYNDKVMGSPMTPSTYIFSFGRQSQAKIIEKLNDKKIGVTHDPEDINFLQASQATPIS